MAYTLRAFRKEDIHSLWKVDQQCFPPGIAYDEGELAWYLTRRDAFTSIAEFEGRIVGFINALPHRGTGHVITIDVLPEARRSGLGSELMQLAEEHFRQRGYKKMRLETAVDNEPAINFYKRRGYFVTSTKPRYYLGSIDALVLEKALD